MKRFHILLPDSLLEDVVSYCREFKYERSEFIRSLIRNKIYADKRPLLKSKEDKIIEAEVKLETVNKKVSQVSKTPASSSPNAFTFCPKHKVFYASCGCTPK